MLQFIDEKTGPSEVKWLGAGLKWVADESLNTVSFGFYDTIVLNLP
jgi:hypothetical protein